MIKNTIKKHNDKKHHDKKHHDKKHHDEKHHDRTTFVRDIASLDQDHLQGVQVILE